MIPAWVRAAEQMPIAFAQVREDPLIDLALLKQFPSRELRMIMIGSGGCTAAFLAASNRLAHLHVVDANPAQIALCRLKLLLMRIVPLFEPDGMLGHANFTSDGLARLLPKFLDKLDLPPDVLGPLERVCEFGPDHSGRYELVFAELRNELREHQRPLTHFLSLTDPAEQTRAIAPHTPFGKALDDALDRVMSLPNLIQLFGEAATQNSIEPFSRHFAGRLRAAASTMPAASNPWLWQMLAGQFPRGHRYPWFGCKPPEKMPELAWSISTMDRALADTAPDSFDVVHLSNILDWLSPDEARKTLELAHHALRPGGMTIIRQLNSTLDIPALNPQFQWLTDLASAWHTRDRSFFYRGSHVGKKRGAA